MNRRRATFVLVVSAALAVLGPAKAGLSQLDAQLRVRPIDLEDGAVALGLTLRQLNSTAVFGARSGATLLTRATSVLAALFVVGALVLTVWGARGPDRKSVV